MSFLEIALSCAARGWFVFPCKPRAKQPLTVHGWKDSSREDAQIKEWWTKWPDANVGIACGPSNLAVFDVDHGLTTYAGWQQVRALLMLPRTYVVRTGRRDDYGVQVYFQGAIPDVGDFRIHGCNGQIKSLGGYVMACGSIHPVSGETYEILEGHPDSLAALPDNIRAIKSYRPTVVPGAPMEKIPVGAGRHDKLTKVAGALRNQGMDYEAILDQLITANISICEVPVSVPDVEHIAKSVCRYAVPELAPLIEFGKPGPVAVLDEEQPEDADSVSMARPVYPDAAWAGTAYAEFADLCTTDNQVPRKFFIEAIRTAVGAIVGDRLHCAMDAVSPRAYTIFIAPPQKGKGTAISRVQELFKDRWEGMSRTESALLFYDNKSLWKARGIGAQIINPASAPGLMMALIPPARSKKETEAEAAPHLTWQPIPRLLTMMEEVRGLFANFTIESTGAGLEGVLCELFDRTTFSATATVKRQPQSGEAMLSLLGGITGEEWEKIFSQTSSAGSGFLSRLNIIGSEGNYPRAASIDLPDFSAFKAKFFPKLQALENVKRVIKPTPSARGLIGDWLGGLDLGKSARINLHAWRTALHIAWLNDSDFITEHHIVKGIAVADYQLQMRDFYSVGEGDNPKARCEGAIRRVVVRGKITLRELKNKTNAYRFGIETWEKCLKTLERSGELRIDKTGARSLVIPLKIKD